MTFKQRMTSRKMAILFKQMYNAWKCSGSKVIRNRKFTVSAEKDWVSIEYEACGFSNQCCVPIENGKPDWNLCAIINQPSTTFIEHFVH